MTANETLKKYFRSGRLYNAEVRKYTARWVEATGLSVVDAHARLKYNTQSPPSLNTLRRWVQKYRDQQLTLLECENIERKMQLLEKYE